MEIVAGLFDQYEAADRAVSRLIKAGYTPESVSLLARREILEKAPPGSEAADEAHTVAAERVEAAAGASALGGGILGGIFGLLAGVGALVIPGIGPVIAAGTLASAIGVTAAGTGLGAATGGLLGALVGLGLNEPESQTYTEGVRRGGILVLVHTEGPRRQEAALILQEAGAIDLEQATEHWRSEGWAPPDHQP